MFDTHKLNDNGFAEVKAFKEVMSNAVKSALALMPEGRECSVFKTKMEEAVFFATKAIASKPGNYDTITEY